MGLFFNKIILKGPEQWRVMSYLRQRQRIAWVSRAIDGITVIQDNEHHKRGIISRRFETLYLYQRGETGWEPLVRDLSASLGCIVLGAEVYDSDILLYELYDAGPLIDEYISDPDPFGRVYGGYEPMPDREMIDRPIKEHAKILCRAFGRTDTDAVSAILADEADVYFQAQDQYTDVMRALGLPEIAGWWGVTPVGSGMRVPGFTATTDPSAEDAPRHSDR
jgi:hypothetical protein